MLIQADARQIPLRDGCVQCVVTSPPYFGLRDYGVAQQIGLEPTPDVYVQTLVEVFREVRRVLNDDGVCWANLGDSYANDTKWGGQTSGKHALSLHGKTPLVRAKRSLGFKAKDLIGIPWRVAFALQADGWYLRSDVIWAKPNPMPESVTDRPTKSHEYLFLLTKSERYYYCADAIKEPYAPESEERYRYAFGGAKNQQLADDNVDGIGVRTRPIGMRQYKGQATKDYDVAGAQNPSDTKRRILDSMENGAGRNKRSVWTVNTMPYAGAHFATMPEALVEPCILAGSRLGDRVLDPFMGSGTVGAVAERLGRKWVGLDLNPAYHELAKVRTAQRGIPFEIGEGHP